MTRKRMNATIRQKLEDEGLHVTDEERAVADFAVRCALDYVLAFSHEVAEELASKELYSEAMVAGVFIRKIKGLIE